MTLREVLTRVLGEAGAAPVETELRPSEVAERARRHRRRVLAARSIAAGATTAVAIGAALVVPGVLLTPGSELPPIASSQQPSSPPTGTGPPAVPDTPTGQPTVPRSAPSSSVSPGEEQPSPPATPTPKGETREPRTEEPPTPAPQGPSILGEPQHSWGTAPKSGAAAGRAARLVDIRVGRHETYDRVVFEFRGGRPGYEVSYDPLDAPGSGKRVALAGSHSLEVVFREVKTPPSYDGPTTLTPRLPSVAQVKYLGGWEGVTKAGIGVSSRSLLGFRVLTLDDPARVVIDVTHASG